MMVNINRGDVYAHRFLLRSLGNNMVLLCDMAAVDVLCYALIGFRSDRVGLQSQL